MKEIKFKYRDETSRWEWRERICVVDSIDECERIYGLGADCEYEIISTEDRL